MILDALLYIKSELQQSLNISKEGLVLGSVPRLAGKEKNLGVHLTFVNLKWPPIPNEPIVSGHAAMIGAQRQAAVLNFHLLLSFQFEDYEDSLAHLSKTIELFKQKPVHGSSDASNGGRFPSVIQAITFAPLELSFEDLKNIWSFMGSPYVPSVVYDVSVIANPAKV